MLRLKIILYMELRPWGNDCASALSNDKGESFWPPAAAAISLRYLFKRSWEETEPVPCPCNREMSSQ